ncbi:MAG: hypothetical protein PHG66_04905 [Candidatus Colwellbacteria bacterium]|nr:hypothetical protein [Candidatus Colwellbacteria bacterium]
MSVPRKVSSYKKYLISVGFTVNGTYTPKKSKGRRTPKSRTPKSRTPKSRTPKSRTPKSRTPKSRTRKTRQNKKNFSSDESESESGSESGDGSDSGGGSESEPESPRRKNLSSKEKAKRFVKDNKHNWRLLQQDCEGNFSKIDLVNFSKHIGVKSSGSSKKICGVLKKELKKY